MPLCIQTVYHYVLKKSMKQPTLVNLNPNECSQELCSYPVAVNLNRCVESFNTLYDLFSWVCVPNETEDLNLHVFDMTAGINESKSLIKHISCKCECNFDRRKCNLSQK